MHSFAEMAGHFERAAARCHGELELIVTAVAETAQILAKASLGRPQESWEPLHDATVQGFRHEAGFWIRGKDERGFSASLGYEPLKGNTGEMGESIESSTIGLTAEVGSNSKVALYQEMGTPGARYPIPPRPFLANAMMHAAEGSQEMLGEMATTLLMPGRI